MYYLTTTTPCIESYGTYDYREISQDEAKAWLEENRKELKIWQHNQPIVDVLEQLIDRKLPSLASIGGRALAKGDEVLVAFKRPGETTYTGNIVFALLKRTKD